MLLITSTILYWLGQAAIVLVVFTIIGIPIWFWESRTRKRKIEATFANRHSMDERQFYERYFEARGVPFFVVSKVRKILENELHADLSRLAAEDDFKRNLSFFWQFDSMADVEIVVRCEEEFDIKITDAEAAKTTTVEELIDLVWLKVRQRAA